MWPAQKPQEPSENGQRVEDGFLRVPICRKAPCASEAASPCKGRCDTDVDKWTPKLGDIKQGFGAQNPKYNCFPHKTRLVGRMNLSH